MSRGLFAQLGTRIGKMGVKYWASHPFSSQLLRWGSTLVKIEAPQGLISSGIGTKERFTETGTAIHTDWYESDFEYHVVARFLVAAERKNMRLYVEKSQIVIEAVKDPTGIQGPTLAPNTKRMSLFLRRKIEIPPNADLKKISSKIVGDTILITIPKKKFSSL